MNEELNNQYPMDLLEVHPNPIIRMEEKNRRKKLLKLIRKLRFSSFADIGCEKGYFSKVVAGYCSEIYAVDIDKRNVDSAKSLIEQVKKNRNKNLKAHYIVSDAQNIRMKDNSVDLAFSSHVLEHLPNPRKGLSELVRITKPGGKIIVSVPNEKFVLFVKETLHIFYMSFLLGNLAKGLAKGHLHVFDKKLIRRIAKDRARIVSMRYDYPFFRSLNVLLKPIKN